MSLDSVNRLNQLMEVLRRRMAESTQHEDAGRSQSIGTSSQPQLAGKPSLYELKLKINERLRSLHNTDPRRIHKAKRIFLETVFAWEFGNDLLLDKRFSEMLDSIEETIDANPELARRFTELMEEMSGGSSRQ